jgi:NAD(P)-dependent dehydrogenase (short-subunit alcohol dehydrogenase family)
MRLDVLVNNAGIQNWMTVSDDDFMVPPLKSQQIVVQFTSLLL